MSTFTHSFLDNIGGIARLFPMIDIAVLDNMVNGEGLAYNLVDVIEDKGFSRSVAHQNAHHVAMLVESGALTTALTRAQYNFPEKQACPVEVGVRIGF